MDIFDTLDGETAIATTFADPADVERYRRAKARGLSDQEAFKYGDNGIGKWGDDTTRADDPIVALPRDLPGVAHNRRVLVSGPAGTAVARVADVMPKRENIRNGAGIDLNPATAAAVGATAGKVPVSWKFIDDPEQQTGGKSAADIFDEVASGGGADIFDQVDYTPPEEPKIEPPKPQLGAAEKQQATDQQAIEAAQLSGAHPRADRAIHAATAPVFPIPRVDQQPTIDPAAPVLEQIRQGARQFNAAAANAGAGLVESLESPLGIATLGTSVLPQVAGRVVSGAFAADMLRHVPEQVKQAYEAPTLQGKLEGALGALTSLGFGGLAGKHALKGNKPAVGETPNIELLEEPATKGGEQQNATTQDIIAQAQERARSEGEGIQPGQQPAEATGAPAPPYGAGQEGYAFDPRGSEGFARFQVEQPKADIFDQVIAETAVEGSGSAVTGLDLPAEPIRPGPDSGLTGRPIEDQRQNGPEPRQYGPIQDAGQTGAEVAGSELTPQGPLTFQPFAELPVEIPKAGNPAFSDIHEAARAAAISDSQTGLDYGRSQKHTEGPGQPGSVMRKEWDLVYKPEFVKAEQAKAELLRQQPPPNILASEEPARLSEPDALGSSGGQKDMAIYAYDPASGKKVGVASYSVYEGVPRIDFVEVLPEAQRKGIGTQLLREVQAHYPDSPLQWTYASKPGEALRAAYERQPEAGERLEPVFRAPVPDLLQARKIPELKGKMIPDGEERVLIEGTEAVIPKERAADAAWGEAHNRKSLLEAFRDCLAKAA